MKLQLIFIFVLNALSMNAQKEINNSGHFNFDKNKMALQGYDLLTYFQGFPQKGRPEISYRYKGGVYYFKSNMNKNEFVAFPDKYLPQYGGWCAYAMGESGEKVEINPKTYKIIQGKLFLFYNKYFTNTLEYWNKDESKLQIKADDYWGEIEKNIH